MVRERVKNRDFHDVNLIPFPAEEKPFNFQGLFSLPQPLEVDIGCGRGRFLLARAGGHPGNNFLGIDRSLLRLKKIDRKATATGLGNIRLLNGDALRVLPLLQEKSVSTFYLFFPDPWPKRRHHHFRIVSPLFLDLTFRALSPGGTIHLCTDHGEYFEFMLKQVRRDSRFQEVAPFLPTEEEKTDFELIFRAQNRPPNRCSIRKSVSH